MHSEADSDGPDGDPRASQSGPTRHAARANLRYMQIRDLRAFVAVAEEGGLSAAARRLHVGVSSLSRTVLSLERRLGVQLLVRDRSGSHTTEAGAVLVREARDLIKRHDRITAAVAAVTGSAKPRTPARLIRVGVPLELPPDRLPTALAQLAVAYPDTLVDVVHSSSASQLAAVRDGDLDVGLVRELPADSQIEASLAVHEAMGVIISTARAHDIAEPAGVHLHKLAGLHWMGFPRSDSPSWHDAVTGTLRAYGISVTNQPTDGRPVTPEVKLGGIGTGKAFGLASAVWEQPLPAGLVWLPLVDNPIIRRTWVIWSAAARQRDIAALIAALDIVAAAQRE